MKNLKEISIIFLLLVSLTVKTKAQSLDFENTIYYTATGNALTTSTQTLAAFDYSSANPTHPLLNDGVYFPIVDFLGNNLWVRVRHIADDPNGTSVGHNVTATASSPFRLTAFGGWFGFLYQFDIYQDLAITGTRSDILNGLFNSNIIIESIETLSQGEWVSFEIMNSINSYWILQSINFTGLNPASLPGFSGVNIPINSQNPPTGFDTIFPNQSNSIYVVDYDGGNTYSEFRVTADNVSQFNYGYEYGSAGGYQGMRMYFGTPPAALHELHDANTLEIYPNPSSDFAIINSSFNNNTFINILDMMGKVVFSASINSFPAKIDVSKLLPGIYTLTMSNDNSVINKQFVIAH